MRSMRLDANRDGPLVFTRTREEGDGHTNLEHVGRALMISLGIITV
jgi:hypothetical protein